MRLNSLPHSVILLALSLGVSGCAGFDFSNLGRSSQPQVPQTIESREQLQTALSTPAPATQDGQNTPPIIAPAALNGATSQQITLWMGRPDAVWTEGGHAMWRYQSQACVILLFVGPDEKVRTVRVSRTDGASIDGCRQAIGQRVGNART